MKIYPSDIHPLIANTLFEIAQVWGYLGDMNKSEFFHKKSLGIKQSTLGADHPELKKSLAALKNFK